MSTELLIAVGPGETRGALLEDGRLAELAIERPGFGSLVGGIHLARVSRVAPGAGAAFLDIGGGRSAFLSRGEAAHAEAVRVSPPGAVPRAPAPEAPIGRLLNEGEALVVQISRDPLAGKDAKATTRIGIPGPRLVHTPTQDRVTFSRRLGDGTERARLGALVSSSGGGFIVRAAAAGASAEGLESEMEDLRRRWAEIMRKARETAAPALLADDPPLIRILHAHAGVRVGRVVVDDRAAARAAERYAERYALPWRERVEYHADPEPLFETAGVEEQIEAALAPRVPLASGGALVIQATEAVTAVDVNVGARGDRGDARQAALDVNIEAAAEIARQLRLRNIGGLVVIDFVRMERPEARRRVVDALAAAVRSDPLPVRVGRMTPFGLVELTRKRQRPSLAETLLEPCPLCAGAGRSRSALTLALEALRAAVRAGRAAPGGRPVVVAPPAVIERLAGEARAARADAEKALARPLGLRADAGAPGDRFEIVVE